MPYRRYKRRNYRRKPRPITYQQIGTKVLKDVAYLRGLINVEYKTITTGFTVDPNTTGAVVNLTAIAQGDDIANRQGNKIRAKYISVKGNVKINASATSTHLRMMIVRDNNGSTTQPAITDLYADANTFRANLNKLGDPQSNSRFSILWDKFVMLDAVNLEQVPVSWTSSLDHHIFYSGTASTDEGKGNLYLFISSSEATNDPSVTANAMVKFIDN